ncbi:putative Integral membrane sensor signal transduction histidine kinase [Hyella patelloides LEGE 07179]|uniref:Putative Integral membrane sensor signal transduction histidine kinase n=1 Tax=Hyella patelloides LEGE 07179 TaxID=945734 RepID=A0A563VKX7_9CYAN|nr:putative Integral membrane sensor signal transduction histidine kinase [Hyella patelloides LEGE 07179]
MYSRLKYFKNSNKKVFLASINIVFLITALRFLGLLQPLEWMAYDLLFLLRPSEPKEGRIVIVAWDEADIEKFQEGSISDSKLAHILEKIKAQKPRIIGLDLFRNVPVLSKSLSKEQNERAYQKLQEIFRSTPNLVGIAKVTPPQIQAPQTLKEETRITSADLLKDGDETIRRAYIHPLEDGKGEPAGIISIGVISAIKYLSFEGFEVGEERNQALTLTRQQSPEKNEGSGNFESQSNSHIRGVARFPRSSRSSKITLRPLKRFDGSYVKKEEGTKILINWRKGNSPFFQVTVSEVLAGSIPANTFKDKIVLIGNTSTSSSDKHHLPINRWTLPSTTNGVETHAQIASSIVSAALDDRPAIETIPEWSEFLILLLMVTAIALIAIKYREKHTLKLFLITTSIAMSLCCCLAIFALVAFFSQGYWIPIVPSLLGATTTPIAICFIVYNDKIEQNNQDLKQLIKDLNHSLQNSLRPIVEGGNIALDVSSNLKKADNLTETIARYEEELGEHPLSAIQENLEIILLSAGELNRQRENSQEYFKIAYLGQSVFSKKLTAFNQLVNKTVQEITYIKQHQYNLTIQIQEYYDPQIKDVPIDSQSFQRVLENLIDNAYYAIHKKTQTRPEHQGIIKITTHKKKEPSRN